MEEAAYRFSTAIIGGGVLGLAVAHRLLEHGFKDIVLLEKNLAFGLEQSGSNSGVIHSGFVYPPGTNMAALCVEGVGLLQRFCRDHDVPCRMTGKLVVATDAAQARELEFYHRQALTNGVKGAVMLSGEEARRLEPCVGAHAALHLPEAGVIDASGLVARLHRRAAALHETPDLIMKGCRVVGITPREDGFLLDVEQAKGDTPRWRMGCDTLVNAAGLHALDVAKWIDPGLEYRKQYLKGEYCQFNRRQDLYVDMNIYPVPVKVQLPAGAQFLDFGAHLTPKVGPGPAGKTAVAREILVGPIFTEIDDPDDYSSRMDPDLFYRAAKPFFPNLEKQDLYRGHTGVLGLIDGQSDFMIVKDRRYANCIHLLGMESPALTASLAIARQVHGMLEAL